VLGSIGVFQTVPSLAMLAILLALVGKIGAVPAIIALTIYAMLPIVRNTARPGRSNFVARQVHRVETTDARRSVHCPHHVG